jgi:hypothetical protein
MLRLLGMLTVLCVVPGGAVVALAMLLNFRDRRQDRLLGTVAPALSDLRGTVGFRIRCAAFWPTSIVRLDMWLCTPREMWDTSLRVLEQVRPGVRIVVEGPVNRKLVGTLTLVARRYTALGPPRQADELDDPGAAPADDHVELRRTALAGSRLGAPTHR